MARSSLLIGLVSLGLSACASTWSPPVAGPLSPELSEWSAYGLALGEHHSFGQMEAQGLIYEGVHYGDVYWRSRARAADGALLEVITDFPPSAHAAAVGPDGQNAPVLEVVSIRAEFPATDPRRCSELIARHAEEMRRANPMLSVQNNPASGGFGERAILSPTDGGGNTGRVEMWCGWEGAVFFVLRSYPTDSLGDFILPR